jgi:hypothetical protein
MNTSATDGFDVLDVIGRNFHFRDAKDWEGMRSLWTDTVNVDYGTVFPVTGPVQADALKHAIASVLGPIPLTQHMVSTPVVDLHDDTAAVRFYLQVLHHHSGLGEDERTTDWTLYARDVIGLDRTPTGWKVSSENLLVLRQTGNTNFVAGLRRLADAGGAD